MSCQCCINHNYTITFIELHKDTVILKPDKYNGVVVTDMTDYYESLNKSFSDKTKFNRLDADPTNTRLSNLQS